MDFLRSLKMEREIIFEQIQLFEGGMLIRIGKN